MCGLTFELSGPRRQGTLGPECNEGQVWHAGAGPLERGVRRHIGHAYASLQRTFSIWDNCSEIRVARSALDNVVDLGNCRLGLDSHLVEYRSKLGAKGV